MVTSTANPLTFGNPVTYTATVTDNAPTGTVTFKDGAAVSGGVATCPVTSTINGGTHPITGIYSGDLSNAGSTSPVYNQSVVCPASPKGC
ncbi:MAG: Ig-like domain-containing protein [Burkholderiales bacterium]